jgi:DNA invertase Pin-like site-specific DNA recombinase
MLTAAIATPKISFDTVAMISFSAVARRADRGEHCQAAGAAAKANGKEKGRQMGALLSWDLSRKGKPQGEGEGPIISKPRH